MKFHFFALALTAFCAFSFTHSGPTSEFRPWEKLGSKKIDYGLDRDEIVVGPYEGHFTAIKFIVRRSPVNMHKVAVHYGNGEIDEINVQQNFPANGESRVLELRGNRRIIQKVVFWYDTKNFAGQKGILELWGRH
jgi:hypothetical protein